MLTKDERNRLKFLVRNMDSEYLEKDELEDIVEILARAFIRMPLTYNEDENDQ